MLYSISKISLALKQIEASVQPSVAGACRRVYCYEMSHSNAIEERNS